MLVSKYSGYPFCDIIVSIILYLCINKVSIPGFNDTMLGTSYTTVSKYSDKVLFPLFFQSTNGSKVNRVTATKIIVSLDRLFTEC